MAKNLPVTHKQRADTSANWLTVNPTLQLGEIGFISDSIPLKMKVGDGVTQWNSLPFISVEDNFFYGLNTVNTLTSLPVSKRLIIASITSATTLSLAASLPVGSELHIKVYNTGATAITQPLPTTAPYESKKTDGANITSVSIPVNGSIEINILSATNKYIIKTYA